MSSSLPKVCVLVVNYKNWRDTLECLESVYSSDYPDFEVVVVDNGSANESGEKILAWARGDLAFEMPALSPLSGLVRRPEGRIPTLSFDDEGRLLAREEVNAAAPRLSLVTSSRARGCYGGFNLGVQAALKEGGFAYVWMLPNDTAVAADCLTRQVEAATRNGWGICGADTRYYDEPGTTQELAGRFDVLSGRSLEIADPARLKGIDRVGGNGMLIAVECFERLGLLPEEYYLYMEDVDFCHRAKSAGFGMGVALDARIYHKNGRGSSRAEKDYYYARNLLHFVRRHRPLAMPFALWYLLFHRPFMKLVTGRYRHIGPLLAGVIDFARGRFGVRAG